MAQSMVRATFAQKENLTMNIVHRLILILIILAICGVIKFFRHYGISYGDPVIFWLVCATFGIYLLLSWKNNISLLKRCIVAMPLASVLALIPVFAGFSTVTSIHLGITIYLLLLIRTENLRQHFTITLTTATIILFTIAAFKLMGWNRENLNIYRIYTLLGCTLPALSFYAAYLASVKFNKTIKLLPLLSNSLKFTGVTFLLFVLFTVSHMVCRHYRLGLMIPFAISVLLALGFLWVCYRFKINLSDNSISGIKKNEIMNQKFIDKPK
jgi:hypothetical protein